MTLFRSNKDINRIIIEFYIQTRVQLNQNNYPPFLTWAVCLNFSEAKQDSYTDVPVSFETLLNTRVNFDQTTKSRRRVNGAFSGSQTMAFGDYVVFEKSSRCNMYIGKK